MAKKRWGLWDSFGEMLVDLSKAPGAGVMPLSARLPLQGGSVNGPPPPWNPDGQYRVILEGTVVSYQERRNGTWVAASTEKPEALATKPEVTRMGINIFISHSSLDAELAKKLVYFIESGIVCPPKVTIRCSSVAGYTLTAGDKGPERLRQDLEDCGVVVGLVTKNSLESNFVLMELGAGWGLEKRVIFCVAPGVSPNLGPFTDVHRVKLESSPDMIGIFEPIAEATGLQLTQNGPKSVDAWQDMMKVTPAQEVSPRPPFPVGS